MLALASSNSPSILNMLLSEIPHRHDNWASDHPSKIRAARICAPEMTAFDLIGWWGADRLMEFSFEKGPPHLVEGGGADCNKQRAQCGLASTK
jgi:hypothetical protein